MDKFLEQSLEEPLKIPGWIPGRLPVAVLVGSYGGIPDEISGGIPQKFAGITNILFGYAIFIFPIKNA